MGDPLAEPVSAGGYYPALPGGSRAAPGPSCAPGIVRAEVPDVAFGIAAGVAAAAIVFGLDVHDDLRASRLGTGIVGVGVVNDEIGGLRLGATDLVRLLHQPAELAVADGAQHDHAVAEAKLGMCDRTVLAWNHEVALEPERLAQP